MSVSVTTWPKKKERDSCLAPELFGEVSGKYVFSILFPLDFLFCPFSLLFADFWS